MASKKNKAKVTKEAAKLEFPDTRLDLIKPCETKPYFKKGIREDYVLATQDAAKKKAFELAGIDLNSPRPNERVEEIVLEGTEEKTVIGYKAVNTETGKLVAEVHFHPADLAGHPAHLDSDSPDYISAMPHCNYSNWRAGKKEGKRGHVVFQG